MHDSCLHKSLQLLAAPTRVAYLQGLSGMGLEESRLRDIMTQISMASAFGSVVLGELPPMTRQQADDLLADNSLLGIVKPVDSKKDLQVRHLSATGHSISWTI